LSQSNWNEIRRRWQEAECQREQAEGERQAKARNVAAYLLSKAGPPDSHAYLAQKGVKPTGDLRQSRGLLVVPLRDADGTLTHEQVDAFEKTILAELTTSTGAVLRTA
jgi:putative DNA primase/helicase